MILYLVVAINIVQLKMISTCYLNFFTEKKQVAAFAGIIRKALQNVEAKNIGSAECSGFI